MPKMDGYKATQEIRHLPDKDKACIPIIAMTASAFEEDKREAIASVTMKYNQNVKQEKFR